MRDFYDILGVNKNASNDEIKRAYRKIAMKNHPDKNPGNTEAEQVFKEAAEAYSLLSDSQKRAQYDQFGHAGVGMGGMGGSGGFQGHNMSMDDIFSQFSDIFGGQSPFQDIFGGATRRESQIRKGKDLRISIEVDYSDVLNGTEKKIRINRFEACDSCDGSGAKAGTSPSQCRHCGGKGQVQQVSQSFFGQSVVVSDCPVCYGEGVMNEHPCRSCSGRGISKKQSTIKISVPKGVSSGNYMTLSNEGNKGGNGIEPGDLLVYFEEKEHPYFIRNGLDLFVEAEVPVYLAALGGKIDIPTIGGKASLKIPSGIQSGQILRMREKGFPKLRGGQYGDQLVRIQVSTPTSISKKEKDLLSELASLNGKSKIKFNKVEF
tara:strand:+ start:186 stop:1310 length:1125 start_codon:yes stop_codon:yes gene_type:complete